VRAEVDPSVAGWIGPRLLSWWSLPDGFMPVGAVIPTGFESYARVLHPPEGPTTVGPPPLRWSDLAARRGIAMTAGTSWEDVAPQDDVPEITSPPSEGHLAEGAAGALVKVLERWMLSPGDCWFGIWEGYGALDPDRRWPGAARLHLPNRDYVLLKGPFGRLPARLNLHRLGSLQTSGGRRTGPGASQQRSTMPGPTSGVLRAASRGSSPMVAWRLSWSGPTIPRSDAGPRPRLTVTVRAWPKGCSDLAALDRAIGSSRPGISVAVRLRRVVAFRQSGRRTWP
jgi:hypothetical protein